LAPGGSTKVVRRDPNPGDPKYRRNYDVDSEKVRASRLGRR
jgi:hypothetical protein